MQGALSDCHFKDGEMDGVGVVDRGWGEGIIFVLALLEEVPVVGPLTL